MSVDDGVQSDREKISAVIQYMITGVVEYFPP